MAVTEIPEGLLCDWCRAASLVNKAQSDLNRVLGAGELVDLFADNFAWPLDYCRAMRDLVLQVRAEMYCTASLAQDLRERGEL